jgi:hypothetical protein
VDQQTLASLVNSVEIKNHIFHTGQPMMAELRYEDFHDRYRYTSCRKEAADALSDISGFELPQPGDFHVAALHLADGSSMDHLAFQIPRGRKFYVCVDAAVPVESPCRLVEHPEQESGCHPEIFGRNTG